MKFFSRILLISTLLMIPISNVYSADGGEDEGLLNKLLAPGKLISGHIKLESECLSCHAPGKGIPNSKCIAIKRSPHKFL